MALGNIIESFFVYLGFEIGDEELKEWTEKLHDVENVTAAVGAVCLAAAGTVALFVHEVAEGIGELNEFAERNELNVERVQELGFAASVTGSSLEAVKSTLQGLNQIIGEAALGVGRGAAIFKQLHLSARGANGEVKTSTQMLTELSNRMKGMSVQEALGLTRRLRIDPSLITLMRRGGDNLARLTEEARKYGIVSKEEAERANEVKDSWVRMLYLLKVTGELIAVKLLPVMLRLQEGLRGWVLRNRALISSGLVTFIKAVNAVIGTAWDWTTRLAGVIFKVVQYVTQWKGVSDALLVVLGAIVTAGFLEMVQSAGTALTKLVAKVWELDLASAGWGLLLGGLVLALGLLVDDLWNYYHGNDSLIGQLEKKYPNALLYAKVVTGLLSAALIALKWSAIESAAAFVASMASMVAAMVAAIPEAYALAAAMLAIDWPVLLVAAAIGALIVAGYELWKHWTPIAAWFKQVWEDIVTGVTWAVNKIKQLNESVKEFFQGIPHHLLATMHLVNDPVPVSGPDGRASGSQGRMAAASSTHQTVYHTPINAPITVLSPDPDRAGVAVENRLRQLHSGVTRDGQTGVGL